MYFQKHGEHWFMQVIPLQMSPPCELTFYLICVTLASHK